MNLRLFERFRCTSPMSAARVWEVLSGSIQHGSFWQSRTPGLYGQFDYRERIFRLRHYEPIFQRGISPATAVTVELIPQESWCEVEITLRPEGAFAAFCAVWLGFALLMLGTLLLQFRLDPTDSFLRYGIVHTAVMLGIFLVMMLPAAIRETNAARQMLLDIVCGRDIEQLPLRRRERKAAPQTAPETVPAFTLPKGHYAMQVLCGASRADTAELLDRALRYPSDVEGIREGDGWRLQTHEGHLGLRPSVLVELFEHPQGCVAVGTVRHHPLLLAILLLLGAPTAVIALIAMGMSVVSWSAFGCFLSLVLLIPSGIVWGAGAAFLAKEREHLCSAVTALLPVKETI